MNRRHIAVTGFLAVAIVSGTGFGMAYAGGTTSPNGTAVYDTSVNQANYQQAQGVALHQPTAVEKYAADHPSDLDVLGGGGCTVGYGLGSKCLPVTPPSAAAMQMTVQEMPWRCNEVHLRFPHGIAVNNPGTTGSDPAGLDSNHDGIACGPGDQ